jgi:hypothetical protein
VRDASRRGRSLELRDRERWRLLRLLEPDEQVKGEGATIPGKQLLLVTSRRLVIGAPGGILSIPFDHVTGAREEVFDTHRYRLRLQHQPITVPPEQRPLPWDLPAHIRQIRRRSRLKRETVLEFSRRETIAADAIRRQLLARLGEEAFADPPIVWPHRRALSRVPLVQSRASLTRHPRR